MHEQGDLSVKTISRKYRQISTTLINIFGGGVWPENFEKSVEPISQIPG